MLSFEEDVNMEMERNDKGDGDDGTDDDEDDDDDHNDDGEACLDWMLGTPGISVSYSPRLPQYPRPQVPPEPSGGTLAIGCRASHWIRSIFPRAARTDFFTYVSDLRCFLSKTVLMLLGFILT